MMNYGAMLSSSRPVSASRTKRATMSMKVGDYCLPDLTQMRGNPRIS